MEVTPLDKNSSTPLYRQLMEIIKEEIRNNVLKPNDRILTETELSEKYDVSRITVRKAIAELVEEGYLIKQQGVGTFVAEQKMERNMSKFMGFTHSCEIIGKKSSSILLFAGLKEASNKDIKDLQLENDSNVLSIKRVRFCDDVPVMIEDARFSKKYSFLLTEDLTGSLYKILKKYEIFPCDAYKELDVCFPSEEEAELLNIDLNVPLLKLYSVTFDKKNTIIHNTRQIINPRRFKMIL
ncbi:GntR family transcriptional regulator [Defluviitalea phaphyphila]|uniref:GntR family transcriptional regulator n=1 Tax=Defluviitalea phaphyphila TaxID=1473580 RepID=UPI000730703F|nr:GntR family transcriptional regulator [Defluviitalea phaphyphila]